MDDSRTCPHVGTFQRSWYYIMEDSLRQLSFVCLQRNIILHRYFQAHYPESNGAAVSAVKIAKRILRQDDIFPALISYRTTPIEAIGGAQQRWWWKEMNMPRQKHSILPGQIRMTFVFVMQSTTIAWKTRITVTSIFTHWQKWKWETKWGWKLIKGEIMVYNWNSVKIVRTWLKCRMVCTAETWDTCNLPVMFIHPMSAYRWTVTRHH